MVSVERLKVIQLSRRKGYRSRRRDAASRRLRTGQFSYKWASELLKADGWNLSQVSCLFPHDKLEVRLWGVTALGLFDIDTMRCHIWGRERQFLHWAVENGLVQETGAGHLLNRRGKVD